MVMAPPMTDRRRTPGPGSKAPWPRPLRRRRSRGSPLGRDGRRRRPACRAPPPRGRGSRSVLGIQRQVGGQQDDVGGDARVEPRLGGDQAGVGRSAHGGHRHGGPVEIVLLHQLEITVDGIMLTHSCGRTRARPLGRTRSTSRCRRGRTVDDAHDRSGLPPPFEGVGDGLAGGKAGRLHEPAGPVRRSPSSVIRDSRPAAVDVAVEPGRQLDRALTEEEPSQTCLRAPAVAGDGPDTGDVGRRDPLPNRRG